MKDAYALQWMLARACLADDAESVFERDLAGFVASYGVAPEDAEALLAAPRRLGLYRSLVRGGVRGVVDRMLALTRARLDARVPGELDRVIARFLDELGPRTPHLRDVPSEVLAYAVPRWRADARVPRWIPDYAELELVDFTISVAPRPPPPPPVTEVATDRPLVFADPKRLVSLDWAVHELPRDDVMAEPEERRVALLVYRDETHRARYLSLSPLAAKLLERLFEGDALGLAIASACAAQEQPLDDSVLAGVARVLADLGERGVLLGGASPEAAV